MLNCIQAKEFEHNFPSWCTDGSGLCVGGVWCVLVSTICMVLYSMRTGLWPVFQSISSQLRSGLLDNSHWGRQAWFFWNRDDNGIKSCEAYQLVHGEVEYFLQHWCWSVKALRTLPEMSFGPAAFLALTFLKDFLTLCHMMIYAYYH